MTRIIVRDSLTNPPGNQSRGGPGKKAALKSVARDSDRIDLDRVDSDEADKDRADSDRADSDRYRPMRVARTHARVCVCLCVCVCVCVCVCARAHMLVPSDCRAAMENVISSCIGPRGSQT